MTFEEVKKAYLDAAKDPSKADDFLGSLKDDYDGFSVASDKLKEQEKTISELTESKNKLLEKLILKQDVSGDAPAEEEEKTGVDWDAIISGAAVPEKEEK